MITYAQNFEDVMLQRLVGEEPAGFYVDIGAWHPTLHSVTRHFYDRGWSGINVEPIASQHALMVGERTRDTNLNVAVSEARGHVRFFECESHSALSTADAAQARLLREKGFAVREYEVETLTPMDIAELCGSRVVQFLKVDVEGLEPRILGAIDWSRFRPRVLVVEATRPHTPIVDWDAVDDIAAWAPWEPGVLAGGYRFGWYDGLSRFYVREEDARLLRRLRLPPGVHDDIRLPAESASESMLRASVARLDADYAAAREDQQAKEAVIARLGDRLDQALGAVAARKEVIRAASGRELARKAFMAGLPDLGMRLRPPRPRASGRSIPAARRGGGMHVAVDTLELVFGVSGGVETYMEMLVHALQHGGMDVTLLCLPEQFPHLRAKFGDGVGYYAFDGGFALRALIGIGKRLGRSERLVAQSSFATFSRLSEDLGVDVLHSPVQIYSLQDFVVPSVLNLHDLQHLHFPENFRASDIEARNRLYGLSARLADAVIVSSDFVRGDVISRMEIPAGKVFTIPVTWNPRVEAGLAGFDADAARRRYRLPGIFAFYPAQFWPHKNHPRLIEAVAIARRERPAADLQLVLTGYRGHSGWATAEAAIRRHGLEGKVHCLDHLPVEHLAGIYKASAFCVMPSTFEASSYPVIEAQVLEVPAMCSNVTSLPELVRGGCGLLFDPFEPADISRTMVSWLDDPADAAAHAARAREKVRREHGIDSYIRGLAAAYDYARSQGKPN